MLITCPWALYYVHGLKGEIKVKSLPMKRRFDSLKYLYLKDDGYKK